MNIIVTREALLKPLQLVFGAIEKKHTLPILSHVLLQLKQDTLWLVATDLEIELIGHLIVTKPGIEEFSITVPAKKLLDICRNVPDSTELSFSIEQNRFLIRAGRSRFSLVTLPASEFPRTTESKSLAEFTLPQSTLKDLLNKTYFAMAQQDVRYYLNGMLFDLQKTALQTVSTDGHRLALSSAEQPLGVEQNNQVIVPRKAILELIRLLDDSDSGVVVSLTSNHLRVTTSDFTFISKLMDGKFPDFNRVIPKNPTHHLIIDRDSFKQALSRVAILCNEKYHSVRLLLQPQQMLLIANNPEQEEAQEDVEIQYEGNSIEMGFNINYLLDVLNVLPSGEVSLAFSDSNTSVLLKHLDKPQHAYVIMPMRL